MEIKIVTHSDMRSEYMKLIEEAQELMKKIGRLNARYNSKLEAVRRKIAQIEASF